MIRKLSTIKNKRLLLIIELELVVLLIFALFFWRDILNVGNIVKYANSDNVPVVAAGDGYLEFDDVRVKVPHEGASYVIGYDWAEGDEDYPSIPSSASAYYTDDSDAIMYEVLLYRNKVTPKPEGDDGSALDAWFDEWEQSKSDSEQEAFSTPYTKGFLIRSSGEVSDEESENNKEYCSYTYYFAVETDSNIEQYVLEINYYDPASIDAAEDTFKSCAGSLSVRNPV